MDQFGHWYAYRDTQNNYKRKRITMHRLVMGVTDSKVVIDHANLDGLDNRKSKNLRACTNKENCRNARPYSGKKDSRFKGVYFNREVGKFRAQIMRDNKKYNLGSFATEEEAGQAYDNAARVMFGEFARCNFPAPTPTAVPA